MADDLVHIPRPGSPPRRLRACTSCTKAKARCHFRGENMDRHLCDRCEGLGIECAAKSKGMRKPRQLKPLQSRVSTLEQKIDDLTARLAVASNPPGTSASSNQQLSLSIRTPESTSTSHGSLLDVSGATNSSCNHEALAPLPQNPLPTMCSSSSPPPYGLTWEQAAWILNDWRQNYMPKFPFVPLAAGITPHTLCIEKPFLFRAIMVVAAPLSLARLVKMKRNVLAYLWQHMLVEDNTSMDLLQGMLVLNAWSQVDSCSNRQFTKLVYLTAGCAHGLGITSAPLSIQRQGNSPPPDDVRQAKKNRPLITHSLDEQRTYLGSVYVMYINSAYSGRKNCLLGNYVDTCCQALLWTQNNSGDYVLEKLVRLVEVSEKISHTFGLAFHNDRKGSYSSLLEGKGRPIRNELAKIAEGMTPDHPDFQIFSMHYNYVLTRLYEPATYLTESSSTVGSATYHLHALSSCLEAAKSFLTTLLEIPPERYANQTSAVTEQTQFVTVVASRLLLLEVEGWNLDLVRQSLDLVGALDGLISGLDAAQEVKKSRRRKFARDFRLDVPEDELNATAVGDGTKPGEYDVFTSYARNMRCIRDWFAARIAGTTEGDLYDMDWGFNLEGGIGEGLDGGAAVGGGPNTLWVMGLLGNSAWSFDEM